MHLQTELEGVEEGTASGTLLWALVCVVHAYYLTDLLRLLLCFVGGDVYGGQRQHRITSLTIEAHLLVRAVRLQQALICCKPSFGP